KIAILEVGPEGAWSSHLYEACTRGISMLYRSILGLVFISLVFTIPVEARQGQSAAKPSKNLVSRAKSKQGQTSASRRNRSQLSSKKARSKARVRRANGFPVAAHKVRRDKAEIHSALEE